MQFKQNAAYSCADVSDFACHHIFTYNFISEFSNTTEQTYRQVLENILMFDVESKLYI